MALCSGRVWASDCHSLIQKSQYNEAEKTCLEALKKQPENSLKSLNTMLDLVTIYHELQSEQEAYFLAKAKLHPQFLNHLPTQYEWHRKAGQKKYSQGLYQQSHDHLFHAFRIAEQENHPVWLSKSHNDMGLVLYKLGDFTTSLHHYQNSLALKKEHGTTYQVAKTLNNLGLIHLEQELPDKAIYYYEAALANYLKYTEESDFDKRVYGYLAHLYEDLTRVYIISGDTEKAKYYAQAVVENLGYKPNDAARLRALLNLAQWHLDNNNQPLLSKLLTGAEKLINTETRPDFLAQYHLLKAHLRHRQDQLQEALVAIEAGLVTAGSSSLVNNQLRELKARVLEQVDPVAALSAYKDYQHHREQFLQRTYDSDLKTIQHAIETQKMAYDLTEEQLTNTRQAERISRMTNWILVSGLAVVILFFFWVVSHIRKKREREQLLQSIHHHEQQLLLLEATQEPHNNQSDVLPKQQLKSSLVNAMLDAVMVWEKTTQSSQIELAEQSRVWTVSVDNGTLRTRSLDKYLSQEKIPKNPRWRNVVKTVHFILSQDGLAKDDRTKLEQHIDAIMNLVK